MFISDN